MKLLEAAREADGGSLVSEVPLDLAGDGERRESREFESKVGVEALDGLDQSEVADLHYVVERLPAVLELAREEVDEVVIGVDELLTNALFLGGIGRFPVTAMERPQLLAGDPPLCTHRCILSPFRHQKGVGAVSLPGT